MENFLESLLLEQRRTTEVTERNNEILSNLFRLERKRAADEKRDRNDAKKEAKQKKKGESDTQAALMQMAAGQKKNRKEEKQEANELMNAIIAGLGTAGAVQTIINNFNNPGSGGKGTTPGGAKPSTSSTPKPTKPTTTTKPTKPTTGGGGTKPTKPTTPKPTKPQGGPVKTTGSKGIAPKGSTPGKAPSIPKPKPTVKPPASAIKPGALIKGGLTGAASLGIGVALQALVDMGVNKIDQEILKAKLGNYILAGSADREKMMKKYGEERLKAKDAIESPTIYAEKVAALGGETMSEKEYRFFDNLIKLIEAYQVQETGGRTLNAVENQLSESEAKQVRELLGGGAAPPSINPAQQLDPKRYQSGGPVTVPGYGSGDKVPMMLEPGSFVMNRNAVGMFQNGGMVPTLLEPGEQVYAPGTWNAMHAMMNSTFGRFQTGGEVSATGTGRDQGKPSDSGTAVGALEKMNDNNIQKATAGVGLCVTGSLLTMEKSNVNNPHGTGGVPGNNPRGAMVQLINKFGWGAMAGTPLTLEGPPQYGGNAPAAVLSADEYQKLVDAGQVPSGALVFATRHGDWNGTNDRSRGYDMAITQKQGNAIWNGIGYDRSMIYEGATKQVILLTPGGQAGGEGTGITTGGGTQSESLIQTRQDQKKDVSGLAALTEGKGPIAAALIKGFFGTFGEDGAAIADALAAAKGKGGTQAAVNIMNATGTPNAPGTGSLIPSSAAIGGSVYEVIASGEGDYNSMNRGVAGDSPGGAMANIGQNLTDMTVGQIMDMQAAKQLFAVGKYQIIPGTMKEFVKGAGISRDDLFDADTQEKFTSYVTNTKRPAVGAYFRGEGSVEEAGQALAREFASVGLQYAEGGFSRGSSLYADRGGNAASITPEEIVAALEKDKASGKYQMGGVVNTRGAANQLNTQMMTKSQEQFAQKIADASTPIVIPMPVGGGGGGSIGVGEAPGNDTSVPMLSAQDTSVAAMEYKFRITMGASV